MLNTYEDIRAFYSDVYMQHGDTPAGAAWLDKTEHYERLRLATKLVKLMGDRIPARVLEVGCGWGILPVVWQYDGEAVNEYTGIDVTDVYIGRAQSLFQDTPGHVFVNQAIQDFPVVEPYGLVIGIGVLAWQPKLTVTDIISRMWEATVPGGLMLLTYLPGQPLVPAEVQILRSMLGCSQWCEIAGYSKAGERMVILKRGAEEIEYEGDSDGDE